MATPTARPRRARGGPDIRGAAPSAPPRPRRRPKRAARLFGPSRAAQSTGLRGAPAPRTLRRSRTAAPERAQTPLAESPPYSTFSVCLTVITAPPERPLHNGACPPLFSASLSAHRRAACTPAARARVPRAPSLPGHPLSATHARRTSPGRTSAPRQRMVRSARPANAYKCPQFFRPLFTTPRHVLSISAARLFSPPSCHCASACRNDAPLVLTLHPGSKLPLCERSATNATVSYRTFLAPLRSTRQTTDIPPFRLAGAPSLCPRAIRPPAHEHRRSLLIHSVLGAQTFLQDTVRATDTTHVICAKSAPFTRCALFVNARLCRHPSRAALRSLHSLTSLRAPPFAALLFAPGMDRVAFFAQSLRAANERLRSAPQTVSASPRCLCCAPLVRERYYSTASLQIILFLLIA